MILVEADSSEEWDSSSGWALLADKAVRAAVAASRHHHQLLDSPFCLEVSVKFTNNDEVQSLNSVYRGKDKPTNVLSFPMVDPDFFDTLDAAVAGEALLGDIVLAHGICIAEAEARRIGTADHATHLLVHGALHLLGYDHEFDEEDALAMEQLEREALASLGIADPYMTEAQP